MADIEVEPDGEWIKIRYFSYWDVPRTFILPYENRVFFFECHFDEEIDDYPTVYCAWELSIPVSPAIFEDLQDAFDTDSLKRTSKGQLPDFPIAGFCFNRVRKHLQGWRCYAWLQFVGNHDSAFCNNK